MVEKVSELMKNKVQRLAPEKLLKFHKNKNMIPESIEYTEVLERHQTTSWVLELKFKMQLEQESEIFINK